MPKRIEFGIGMFGDLAFDPGKRTFQSPKERLKEMIEEVRLADELGLDCFVLGEHHRPDYAVSSTEIVLSALSTVTRNIKLGSGVTVLSSTDPVKVYQDYVTLDLLSNGRGEIMAGRGSFTESFPLFGYDLNDYNELFTEKLDLLLLLNKEEIIHWEGKFRAPIQDQVIYPRPERELPVWIAVGGTPSSIERAGRLGLPIIFAIIGGRLSQFKPLVDYYKEVYRHYGHPEDKMQIGIHSHTFVTDSQDYLLENYFPHYAAQMDRIGKSRGWQPYTQAQFRGGMSNEGALFMGYIESVKEKITGLIEMFGITRFVAHIDVGAPSHDEIMRCIELYATEVVPEIKKNYRL